MASAAPCVWGSRLAIPTGPRFGGGAASIDDVRALVDAVHGLMEVACPRDDFFLNLLGTGRLAGRLPKSWIEKGLNGRVVILGANKIRTPHADALRDITGAGDGVVESLARAATEIDRRAVRDAVDVLAEEARGGPWCWRRGGDLVSDDEAIAQEDAAWESIGATPRDSRADLEAAASALAELEATHGGNDPRRWRWGQGAPCSDAFEADAAARRHGDLVAKVATLRRRIGRSAAEPLAPRARGAPYYLILRRAGVGSQRSAAFRCAI